MGTDKCSSVCSKSLETRPFMVQEGLEVRVPRVWAMVGSFSLVLRLALPPLQLLLWDDTLVKLDLELELLSPMANEIRV